MSAFGLAEQEDEKFQPAVGPAFNLPSIDAECIAAIALLRAQHEDGWTITPNHDITIRLPYLATDDDKHIHGYNNIARYVTSHSNTVSPITDSQRADSTALSSFLTVHAQTLLDISLYVSYENYATTRSAYTKILPWHSNYILPPKFRAAARKRTEQLGVSSIDVEDVHDDLMDRPQGFDTGVGQEKKFEAETQKRASLLLGRQDTVRGLLRKGQGGALFKLHALADNCFEVMRDMLGEKEYFLGTKEPTDVDCLAYGYLSLMLYPQLPQDWLGKILRKKYPALVNFTEKMHERLGLATNADAVMGLASCASNGEVVEWRKSKKLQLPWQAPASAGFVDVTTTVAQDLLSRIPLLAPSTTIITTGKQKTPAWRTCLPATLLAAAVGLGSFGYYAFTTGLLIWPHGQQVHIFGRKRLTDYGHLGAALAGVSLLSQQASQARQEYGNSQEDHLNVGPVKVEVEVEKEDAP
ncbi:uncharacterized protein LTR77_003719 [Saxophila tyrrhenica]|uniref:Uncharacterized protein n=1 Tax=Saxophila tyrrhenica TaxID=1690608 RepID=A0AAV9PIN2_9PEZI|nr:hypothetical protein LTR77_003719 [Saxophila tyrrhenica]